jgi:hypothetical protein
VRTFADISFSTFRFGELSASLPLIFLSLKKAAASDKAMDWRIILPGTMKNAANRRLE